MLTNLISLARTREPTEEDKCVEKREKNGEERRDGMEAEGG